MNRVFFVTLAGTMLLAAAAHAEPAANRPNIIFVVADDMGWRDTGYQGSPHAKTPNLDQIATQGLRFDYFYPGQQMCSPGRFAIMTGRNPFRTGLHHLGAMRAYEITAAKALKTAGYATGHFGKWHLGANETSPAKMGFDTAIWKINYFDLGANLQIGDTKETVSLEGDTSVATMKLAREFIGKQAAAKQPFFVQVCFGSPHAPHQGAEEFKALYKDAPEKQRDFLAELSGVDAAVGELRAELKKLNIADNTLLWFTSDNGGITPNSQDPAGKGKMNVGVRTVSVLEWPARIKQPIRTSVPAAHVDMYPTVLEITGVKMPGQLEIDGLSLLPLFDGKMTERNKPLGFMLWNEKGTKFEQIEFTAHTQGVWIDGKYKLIVPPIPDPDAKKAKQKAELRLFDIFADPAEEKNLATELPDVVTRMRTALDAWRTKVRRSFDRKEEPAVTAAAG